MAAMRTLLAAALLAASCSLAEGPGGTTYAVHVRAYADGGDLPCGSLVVAWSTADASFSCAPDGVTLEAVVEVEGGAEVGFAACAGWKLSPADAVLDLPDVGGRRDAYHSARLRRP